MNEFKRNQMLMFGFRPDNTLMMLWIESGGSPEWLTSELKAITLASNEILPRTEAIEEYKEFMWGMWNHRKIVNYK